MVLEDPSSGELFAAAPYTSEMVVQQANDSSRFFAVRVVGEGGMKATLGLGFEERGVALDFNIALGEARKVLGFAGHTGQIVKSPTVKELDAQMDFRLKEGQKIKVPGAAGDALAKKTLQTGDEARSDAAALFSIAPPPPSPNAVQSSPQSGSQPGNRLETKSAKELGFDDGEFGEFQ